ncbi:MAG: cation transporter, partial [Salinibacter sp.]|uniref:heavy-metal-associated domain-containing protein n=1 Tax=Salinibacter sp. TaxID=2065818 RepID=UPI0035D475B2
ESADVILMGERLGALVDAFEIGANSYRKTKQNLALAFLFNGVGVPLATTGWVDPVWAMAAMAASVSAVLLNSFGGRLVSPREEAEEPTRLTFTIPNMHCQHCAQTIREALRERADGVDVEIDLDEHRLKVALPDGELTPEGVRETLVEAGYEPESEALPSATR